MRVLIAVGFYFAASIAALAADPVELGRGTAPNHPQQPQLAVDAKGSIHAVFGVHDTIHYCRSDDGGQSFGKAVELPRVNAMSLGMRRGPRIAVAKGEIWVTAIGGKQGKGRDGDVLALRSSDGGQTWTGPVQVNDVADSAREGLHAMAAAADGTLCCVWLDLRNKQMEVMASTSLDAGRTWSENVLVYQSPDGSVCPCCHPSVTFDDKGRMLVMWRNSLGGDRDMYLASSSDGGKSFGKATKLGSGSWPLDRCPMDGGSIAVSSGGEVASVWRREKSVYLLAAGASQERLLGIGEQPSITATASGNYVAWLSKRGEQAWLLTPARSSPVELATQAADPVIVSGPGGLVVAAWERRGDKDYSIQCQVIDSPSRAR
jgi:hypothetical protein